MSIAHTYLDYNATAPLRPQARAAMLAALELPGNASSVHREGRQARAVIEEAREAVACLLGARATEVVFTSGATEANNWALRAGWEAIHLSGIEHESVLAAAQVSGAPLNVVPTDRDGVADAGAFLAAMTTGRTPAPKVLISLQAANGETGVVQPVKQVAAAAREHGVTVHSDAVQAVGRLPIDFAAGDVDVMSVSAHKIGGPKGIGALIIRDSLNLPSFMVGGGQERRRRAGTENVAAIAGFGAAAAAALEELSEMAAVRQLRDRLEAGVRALTPSAVVVGARAVRLANTSCLACAGLDAAVKLIKLDLAGVAVSAGSACSSGKIGGSHVLAQIGLPTPLASSAIRVSLGVATTDRDVDRFLDVWSTLHAHYPHRSPVDGRSVTGAQTPAHMV